MKAAAVLDSLHTTLMCFCSPKLLSQAMVLDRIKYQLGYPESAKDMIKHKSLLTAVEQYSMGTERSLEDYLRNVGLDMTSKEVTITHWCETGDVPPGFEHLRHLYKKS